MRRYSLISILLPFQPLIIMSFCANCGDQLTATEKFCPNCGHPNEALSPALVSSPDPVVPAAPKPVVSMPIPTRVSSPGIAHPKKKLSGCAIAGIIGGAVLALLIVILAIVLTLAFSLSSGAVDAMNTHLGFLKTGNIEKAYEGTSAGFRSATSLEQYRAFITSYPVLSSGGSASFDDRSVENGVATISGTITDSAGRKVPLRAQLVKEGTEWKVMAVDLTGKPAEDQSNVPNPPATKTEPEGWLPLFDGKTLNGWQASDSPGSFRVENGAIVAQGPRSHLYYTGPVQNGSFTNFEFSTEVQTFPGANSGVYFHTRLQTQGWPSTGYEVQLSNSDPAGTRPGGTTSRSGSLWGLVDAPQAVASDNEWFTLTIRVEGKRITTQINGTTIVDYTEPSDIVRPENLAGRLLSNGTFALQASDPNSKVLFRSLRVRPLAATNTTNGAPQPGSSAVGKIVVGAGRTSNGTLINPGKPIPMGSPTISADIELINHPLGERVQVWVEKDGNRTEPVDATIEGAGSGVIPYDLKLNNTPFPKGTYTVVVLVDETKRFSVPFEIR